MGPLLRSKLCFYVVARGRVVVVNIFFAIISFGSGSSSHAPHYYRTIHALFLSLTYPIYIRYTAKPLVILYALRAIFFLRTLRTDVPEVRRNRRFRKSQRNGGWLARVAARAKHSTGYSACTPRVKPSAWQLADGTARLYSQWRIAVVIYFKEHFCSAVPSVFYIVIETIEKTDTLIRSSLRSEL